MGSCLGGGEPEGVNSKVAPEPISEEAKILSGELTFRIIAPFKEKEQKGSEEVHTATYTLEIDLESDNSVGKLKTNLREAFKVPKKTELKLFNGPVEVETDEAPLLSYAVLNGALLVLLVQDAMPEEKSDDGGDEKKDDMDDLGQLAVGFIARQKTELDPVLFERKKGCYILSCGHGITAESLFDLAVSQYRDKKPYFSCPHITTGTQQCGEKLEHINLRQILEHAKHEKVAQLDVIAAESKLRGKYGVQRCGKCQALVFRNKGNKNPRGKCPLCKYEMCWFCGEELKSNLCHCAGWARQDILETLASCPTKTIGSQQNIPNTRACPECSQLITHTEACKHMNCRCGVNFCFVCLKLYLPGNGWQCGSSGDVCPTGTHRRQTAEDLNVASQNPLFNI